VAVEAGCFSLCVCFYLSVSLSVSVHRRGPVRYKFHTLYELDNLAVVNVKDTNIIKNAFKLLIFPDTRLFQAESPKAKVLCHHVIMVSCHSWWSSLLIMSCDV